MDWKLRGRLLATQCRRSSIVGLCLLCGDCGPTTVVGERPECVTNGPLISWSFGLVRQRPAPDLWWWGTG
ncbi:hypothetical protein CBM2586_B30101 [Cupriavidus phytorum]|uniref:Uncharacterized protein n=1 Tax=Cupriavidus taiwanensis TaxID=164546 RepID=A0A375CKH0_9BURK|nr:hypothetical protein CBM2586_B30101 [Cupriavidus taiwanensis]